MSLAELQQGVVWGIAVLALLTFFGTLGRANPYGRHMQAGQRFTMPGRPAWLLFECPQWWAFTLCFWLTAQDPQLPAVLLHALWQVHYLYRGLIYPLRRQDQGKRFPVSGVIFGFAFNAANGFANGYAVAHAPHLMTTAWFSDPRFVAGLLVAGSGWLINFHADNHLIALRKAAPGEYRIPQGGLFRWVSCANYSGELLLWLGWALLSWTAAGAVFALFSIANLLPRALSHHQWYQQQFAEYPKSRKALIPGLL